MSVTLVFNALGFLTRLSNSSFNFSWLFEKYALPVHVAVFSNKQKTSQNMVADQSLYPYTIARHHGILQLLLDVDELAEY